MDTWGVKVTAGLLSQGGLVLGGGGNGTYCRQQNERKEDAGSPIILTLANTKVFVD